jgi:hypothetical protein
MKVWWIGLAACLVGCTDAATRIAYQIEAEVARHPEPKFSLQHLPQASPEGCGQGYKVQFSENSLLVIWCDGPKGFVEHSYSTTYHLRFVQVPVRYQIYKKAGEPFTLDLERRGPSVVVTGLR